MSGKNVMVFGECMMELSQVDGNHLTKSFAGDVYNTAVYLKRTQPDVEVSFFSAVGRDNLSDELISILEGERIDTRFTYRDAAKTLGAYMVHLDQDGERSFTYWRSDSAAKRTIQLIANDFIQQTEKLDYFFYSGISLAILSTEDRRIFCDLLKKMRANGIKIVFDPNYRPKLWAGKENVGEVFDSALSCCDLLLPGIEDFDWLFGLKAIDAIKTKLEPYNIPEVIIKNGPETVTCIYNSAEITNIPITPVENVVDTTSAGDSFNGAFLASRIHGNDFSDAVKFAASVAGEVIQHKGAIVPKDLFQNFLDS